MQCKSIPHKKEVMMQVDICYLEKSPLLSESLKSQLPDLNWLISDDETTFLSNLFKTPPLLLVIGDTGTANAVELLYCLKSISGFCRLPIIFFGENEFSHILPVNKIFPRAPESLPEFAALIRGYLNKSRQTFDNERKTWRMPEGFAAPDFLQKKARSRLREEMFQKHLYSEILGMDVTDLSFGDFLNKLGFKLVILLSVDFVSITTQHENQFYRRLILRHDIREEDIEQIRMEYRKALPPGAVDIDITDDATSFIESTNNSSAEMNTSIFLNKPISSAEKKSDCLLLGGFMQTDSHIPDNISKQLISIVSEIIEIASGYYSQVNEMKIIYKAFSQFLPSPIINDLLLKESEKALLTGEKRRIVVLFSHVRNFDYIIEHNEPQKIVEFLNSHFTNMVRIIQQHGGSIDKFIGDAVFAIFGAPISYIDNTKRAVDASLEMIRRFREISTEGLLLPDDGFSIGIGLNEGEAIIGNIGCADKFDYTAIGDTVNLAARLESLTKHYQQDILVSRVVYQQIQKDYYCRLVDRARVKGKSEATEIYSLLADPVSYTEKWRQLYSRGLKMYSLGNWYTAEEYLRECLVILPNDIVCEILLKRCMDFQLTPPENWTGAVALNFK